MSYSKILKKVKNFIIKGLVVLNICSLIFLFMMFEYIETIIPAIIALINITFLYWIAYANGNVYNTKRYREKVKRGIKCDGSGEDF